MAGKLTYIGRVTAEVAIPILALAKAQLLASIPPLVADLSARLAGATHLVAKLGITLPSAKISIAAKLVAALQAALVVTPPSINFQIGAALALQAKLKAILSGLNLALDFAAELGSLLAAGEIELFLYEGPLLDFAGAIDGTGDLEVGSITAGITGAANIAGSVPIYVPIFVVRTSNSATTAALAKLFKTTA